MAYPTIIPATSMPSDGDESNSIELQHYDMLLAHVYTASGTGTAAVIMMDPGGRWVQFGPSWSVAATQAGREVARIAIPRDKRRYRLLVTGGPTLSDSYLIGCNLGR